MRKRTAAVTLAIVTVLCSDTLASNIQFPNWNSDSAVNNGGRYLDRAESLQQQHRVKPVPLEYFQYPAKKPQFAIDVATFHGVPNPQSLYKAYPVRPYTGVAKPELGRHKILDHNREVFRPFQRYTQENEGLNISPVISNFEIFHPYKAKEPILQSFYKDPLFNKIRSDVRNNEKRLQKYENDAGKTDINDDENLEDVEETDRKKVPEKNIPAPYEIHVPQRRPVYYQPPSPPLIHSTRENILNHKFKHPLHQNYAKIKPMHYRPIKTYIAKLKQHQGVKYDDTRNQYPQLPQPQKYALPEPEDGYDIYERGKANYIQLRNNVDESINKAVQENHPTSYIKLELQNNNDKTVEEIKTNDDENNDDEDDDNDEEFVPVKNYAQVRKTETTKHLPKSQAYEDAESFDEMLNAPRLREAIKSTKAQTVYTEEGYEDAAYDHAGEQKHAEEKEGHGGYLKEKEDSGGKYKIPSVSAKYEDGDGKEYGDQVLHDENWKNDNKENEDETEAEDFSEDEDDHSIEEDIYEEVIGSTERNKREDTQKNKTLSEESKNHTDSVTDSSQKSETIILSDQDLNSQNDHGVIKRETKFKIPEINFNSTFLTEDELDKLRKLKPSIKQVDIKEKYPYYFENIKRLNRDSPLRYAENMKFIPKKSNGGSEFYDSKSVFECPEVDEDIDAIPENLKENSNNDKNKGDANMDHIKKSHRLKGLGDKIDCFKAKFFGENPLDSPFFKEDLILNPEPVTIPNKPAYKLIKRDEPFLSESKLSNLFNNTDRSGNETRFNSFDLFGKLQNGQKDLQDSLIKTNDQLRTSLLNVSPLNISGTGQLQWPQQAAIYSDVLNNIKNNQQSPLLNANLNNQSPALFPVASTPTNVTYNFYQTKEDVTKPPTTLRKKRATMFVYEPYKIIKESQNQDSKKTTTSSNINPLIKQLQSSKIIESVLKSSQDKDQPVKRNASPRTYKDIGRKDRAQSKGDDTTDDSFVDVSIDSRRGEPRYELRPAKHKAQYTPVQNKTSMSLEDYMAHTNNTKYSKEINNNPLESNEMLMRIQNVSRQRLRTTTSSTSTTEPPQYDVNQYLPKIIEVQKLAASNTVRRIVRTTTTTTTPETDTKRPVTHDKVNSKYKDGEDKQVNKKFSTTTVKSILSRRTRPTTTTSSTTVKSLHDDDHFPRYPKLRIIMRSSSTTEAPIRTLKPEVATEKITEKYVNDDEIPKYTEKQRKTSKSTIVTDTESYGGGEKEKNKAEKEVDAVVGIKQDIRDYIPEYEKSNERLVQKEKISSASSEGDEESEEEDDDDDFHYDDEDDEDEDYEEEDEPEDSEPEQTTSEPVRKTLPQTTEAPVSTTESRKAKLEQKPLLLTKKKIEIHKEIPANKTAPSVTLFKQDIKEIEIVKEMPQTKRIRKPQKNVEALEIYKDDSLAKEINNLGEVEVFKENLDLTRGPKHGGNYRSARITELKDKTPYRKLHGGNLKSYKDDTVTSQSEIMKLVKVEPVIALMSRRSLDSKITDSPTSFPRDRSRGRNLNPESVTSTETTSEATVEVTSIRSRFRSRFNGKSSESSKEYEQDNVTDKSAANDENIKTNNLPRRDILTMRRGNITRGAKIVSTEKPYLKTYEPRKMSSSEKVAMDKAAVDLNSFAQVVPMLTTPPAYILDPSKRKYYYVDDDAEAK